MLAAAEGRICDDYVCFNIMSLRVNWIILLSFPVIVFTCFPCDWEYEISVSYFVSCFMCNMVGEYCFMCTENVDSVLDDVEECTP